MTDLSKLKAEIEGVQRPKTDLGGVVQAGRKDGNEDGENTMLNNPELFGPAIFEGMLHWGLLFLVNIKSNNYCMSRPETFTLTQNA